MGDIANYFSLLEAARELGLSKSRVEQFVRAGRLKAEWLAGRRVVLKADVRLLKSAARKPGRPKK
jgi:excisionase family DNA binding protein